MSLSLKSSFLFLALIIVNFTYSQNQQITLPSIDAPEELIATVFETKKMFNPIFLRNTIKKVKKTSTSFITPERLVKTVEDYEYIINNKKQITHYASNADFDEMSTDFLNSEKEISISGDTIISHNMHWYKFKNGQLITKKNKTEGTAALNVFVDSTAYTYRNNNLVEIKSYQRDVAEELLEDTDDELIMYISENYNRSSNELGKYNTRDLLLFKLVAYRMEDVLVRTKTMYNYTIDGELESFEISSKKYEYDNFNESDFIKNNEFYPALNNPAETQSTLGRFEYDSNSRIIQFKNENYSSDSTKKETTLYTVSYSKNKRIIRYSSNGKLETEWHYRYDRNKNPIEEKRYVYINANKYLDALISLDIEYN